MLSVIDVKKIEEFIIQMMALIYIIVLRQSRTFKYTGHSMAIKFTSLFLLFHKYLRFTFVYRSGVICLRKKKLRQKRILFANSGGNLCQHLIFLS